MSLCKTWALASTLSEQDCRGFWTPAHAELSGKLWSPTKTDCVDLHLNSSSHLSIFPVVNSLSSTTVIAPSLANKSLLKTSSALSTFSPADKWGDADTQKVKPKKKMSLPSTFSKAKKTDNIDDVEEDNVQTYSRDANLLVSKDISFTLKTWTKVSSVFYDKSHALYADGVRVNAQHYRDRLISENSKKNHVLYMEYMVLIERVMSDVHLDITEKYALRELLFEDVGEKTSKIVVLKLTDEERSVPKMVKYNAIRDFVKAYEINKLKAIDNPFHKFIMKPRNVSQSYSFSLDSQGWYIQGQFIVLIGGLRILLGKSAFKILLPYHSHTSSTDKNGTTIRIMKKNKRWVLTIPIVRSKPVLPVTLDPDSIICGVDPGVRDFGTVYDGSNAYSLDMKGLRKRMKITRTTLDKIRSSTIVKKKRRILLRLEERLKNLRDELHWKIIGFLCSHYQVIAYGDFKVSSLMNKNIVQDSLKRDMSDLSFYMFKQRLKMKAEAKGCYVVFQCEKWTSKTCSCCGSIHETLGANKTFSCPECKYVTDRDVNAARNILIRACTEWYRLVYRSPVTFAPESTNPQLLENQ